MREASGRLNFKHGNARTGNKTPEYRNWRAMIGRCHNPKDAAYERYGGAGITVCDQWRHDFARFLEDMGPRPFPSATVDRINNTLGYSPGNCRWASEAEQRANKRPRRVVLRDEDVIASVFGKLTVSTVLPYAPNQASGRKVICKCECGAEVALRRSELTRSRRPARHCGCSRGLNSAVIP